jgi:transposase-like protein
VGVSEQTLYRWRDEFIAGGEAALARGAGGQDVRERRVAELEKQLAERDQIVGELTIANRFLKKTSGLSH